MLLCSRTGVINETQGGEVFVPRRGTGCLCASDVSADDRPIADGSVYRESSSKSLSGERVFHPQKALAQAKSSWNGLAGKKKPLK